MNFFQTEHQTVERGSRQSRGSAGTVAHALPLGSPIAPTDALGIVDDNPDAWLDNNKLVATRATWDCTVLWFWTRSQCKDVRSLAVRRAPSLDAQKASISSTLTLCRGGAPGSVGEQLVCGDRLIYGSDTLHGRHDEVPLPMVVVSPQMVM